MAKKNRLVSFGFLLIAIVSMTGIANAECLIDQDGLPISGCDNISVWKNDGSQAIGSGFVLPLKPNDPPVPLKLKVIFNESRDVDNATHYLVAIVTPTNGGDPYTIEVVAEEVSCIACPSSAITNTPLLWTQDYIVTTDPNFEFLQLYISSTGNPGETYNITLQDVTTGAMFSFAVADLHTQNIPEFPTIAAPIVAIIGLVFFFQRRKANKVE
ncbi:MAG: PEF-CTERM sorting domain-containing protein [Candidatus Methanoperedens sp.]|nr:PEF-CTERM sorting domain-containing protein [Candidatus Methanoperedens sp.]